MNKLNKHMKKLIALSFLSALLFAHLANVNLSYAEEMTIPDKSNFKDYLKELYELDDNQADIDEKVEKAIKDYKNRYTMYVDIDYVKGKINNAATIDVKYLVNNQFQADRTGSSGNIGLDIIGNPGDTAVDGGTPGAFNPGDGTVTPVSASPQVEAIWEYLINHGYTEIAAAGIMGNMKSESGFVSNNLEDTYNIKWSISDELYTGAVDEDKWTVSKKQSDGSVKFYDNTPDAFTNDAGGYGVVQFTWWTYKQQLYNTAKSRGVSVSDLTTQLDILMTQTTAYQASLNACTVCQDASTIFLHQYEKPKNQSEAVENARGANARGVYKAMTGKDDPSLIAGGNGDYGVTFFQGKAPQGFNTQYFGDTKYGNSTLEVSGAGPTAIAMVVSTLVKYITPDEVAKQSKNYFIKNGGTSVDILNDVEKYGLKVERIGKDTNKLKKALKDGKVAIAVTGSKDAGGVSGIFNRTSDGNFIVIFEENDDETLSVIDPDGGNYDTIDNTKVTYQLLKGEAIGGFYVYDVIR
ncbi:MAG: phage tail tip lysozyme [Clostridia bacterium]|nr:phage tail tip lysozyme [Clostridia bacterium]